VTGRAGHPPADRRGTQPDRREASGPAGAAELAADISRIRHRLMRPGMLTHPGISAELEELDRQVAGSLSARRGRHRLSAAVAVRDTTGYDLKPDPLTAQTGAELVAALRKYREWAGRTPFRAMAERARWEVAHSTMCVALRSSELPSLKVVVAIVAGCGGEDDDQQLFATAWRRISSAEPPEPRDRGPGSPPTGPAADPADGTGS
jgi:hypothetical protein